MATMFKTPQSGTIAWLNYCIEQSKKGQYSELITLTPPLAAELLRRNDGNRNLKPVKIEQMVADIKADRWSCNGETIIVSDSGELNDGQNRCNAVVNANRSIKTWIVFGADRESRNTVDQGAARSASDYAHMTGHQYAAVQSAVARMLIAFENNAGQSLVGSNVISNGLILARINSDPVILESAKFSGGKRATKFCPTSTISFCWYVMGDIDAEAAEKFLDQVCLGEGLKAKDPAYTVRDRLINLGTKNRNKQLHILFRGWNAFRQGRSLSLAKVVGDDLPALV